MWSEKKYTSGEKFWKDQTGGKNSNRSKGGKKNLYMSVE